MNRADHAAAAELAARHIHTLPVDSPIRALLLGAFARHELAAIK
jgi:hypothetical protein